MQTTQMMQIQTIRPTTATQWGKLLVSRTGLERRHKVSYEKQLNGCFMHLHASSCIFMHLHASSCLVAAMESPRQIWVASDSSHPQKELPQEAKMINAPCCKGRRSGRSVVTCCDRWLKRAGTWTNLHVRRFRRTAGRFQHISII